MKIILCTRRFVFLLTCFGVLQSCKKDNTAIDPEIQTISVVALSPSSVNFSGSIVKVGDSPVSDYGFIYGYNSAIDQNTGIKVSLGNSPTTGTYSKQVTSIVASGYQYQTVLYARAYLTNSKGTVFGSLVTVNMPTLSLTGVSPLSGKSGDKVTFNGKFFSPTISQVSVYFGSVQGTVISASDSQIVAQVPSGINAGSGAQIQVQINISGQNLTAATSFVIQANVKDFSPKSGPIGTTITFTGDNLPSYYYYNTISVLFGQVSVSSNGLTVAVPSNITSDNLQLTVIVNGNTTVLPGTFTVTPPTISSLSPTSVLAGQSFTINGTNLPINYYTPNATLGTTSLYAYTATVTQITYTVPTSMSPGAYTFTLTAGPDVVTAPQKLTVVTPSVSGFSPTSGGVGTLVNIQGTFIQNQGYNVTFGNVTGYGTAISSTTLQVSVPSGAQTGNVNISVNINGQSYSAPGVFKVVPPSITSFSPTSGVPGTLVTISGTGFNPNTNYYNATTVTFGTVQAPVTSVTSTSITVQVPSNTGGGAMKISVTTNGQTVVSTSNFTIN